MPTGTRTRMSRRELVTSGAALTVGSAALVVGTGSVSTAQILGPSGSTQSGPYNESAARHDVEYLRRMYGVATDLLGLVDDPAGLEEGREIYRRIFAADAKIFTGPHPIPDETTPLRVGPDGWADYVTAALERYRTTQHLIGTQVARVDEMPDGHPGEGDSTKGHATMSSYVQALHEDGRTMRVVIGIYRDWARVTPQVGWQIYKMNLTTVSVETRSLTE